jgi:hypothetical protein
MTPALRLTRRCREQPAKPERAFCHRGVLIRDAPLFAWPPGTGADPEPVKNASGQTPSGLSLLTKKVKTGFFLLCGKQAKINALIFLIFY